MPDNPKKILSKTPIGEVWGVGGVLHRSWSSSAYVPPGNWHVRRILFCAGNSTLRSQLHLGSCAESL